MTDFDISVIKPSDSVITVSV